MDGLADVLVVLAPAVSNPLTAASWLASPHRQLAGARPIEALRRGAVAAVLRLAKHAAADLTH
ncbi:Protein of unknown function [Geodermatophilus amargosae]|uniref:Uncharacterized protein n=1 Tax=Geodermatophilus amargosae TaxID=1296565 RepID=A0A1I7CP83_9ACTN|nr:antitoxin Xre/MbcA/ParS toxin-binding domain-containing protein [Geodermatophilus amargosae]SFU01214.1 Protein of unknown function [Geodermatophilus amargosae]